MTRNAIAPLARASTVTLLAFGACTASHDDVRVAVVPTLSAPRALLDRAASLSLSVHEGEVTCDPATGTFDGSTGREIAKRELGTTGCAASARFCGDITIAKSATPRVFAAQAKDPSGATVAVGCAQATIEQDAVPIAITMYRFLAPAVCGDGMLQPTEQCEPGGTAICDDDCQSNELLLSIGSAQNGTQTGGPNDKTDPFFVWPSGAGTQGRFFAFFTDRAVSGGGNLEVGLRVMGDDLSPLTSPPALAAGSIFLPNGTTFPPPPAPRQQSLPQAAFHRGKYYVAFQDDDTPGTQGLDIHLRSINTSGGALVAEQGAEPIGINGPAGAGEPNIQGAPALAAGTGERLLVAWEDQGQGKIAGRTFTPPDTLGNQNDISSGTGNREISLAPTTSGWVAVWQGGTGIKLRAINADGTPQGTEQNVNDGGGNAERPRIASLGDGRFAVAWSANGNVFVQRYDERGAKIAGDQAAPVNDLAVEGVQSDVAIGATGAASGSYVVAWVDGPTGHVHARMLGGSAGFLFNPVNGQATAFQASRDDGRVRARPAVVSGGAGPFVAIGWEDRTAPGAGIVARRFPMPTE
jgi:hypothetical protein